MPFSIRPFRRFPVRCAVTYNAGPFIKLPRCNRDRLTTVSILYSTVTHGLRRWNRAVFSLVRIGYYSFYLVMRGRLARRQSRYLCRFAAEYRQ